MPATEEQKQNDDWTNMVFMGTILFVFCLALALQWLYDYIIYDVLKLIIDESMYKAKYILVACYAVFLYVCAMTLKYLGLFPVKQLLETSMLI